MTAPAVLQHAVFQPGRLRAAREARGLSLRDVGGVLGCHHSTPHRFETGRLDPKASVLGLLAGLYGVEVGTFYRTPTAP